MIDIEKIKQAALASPDNWNSFVDLVTPSAILDLITRLEAAEQDAARYRWLRQQESWIPNRSELPSPFCGLVKWIGSAYSENEIDDLIDYAMKEMK